MPRSGWCGGLLPVRQWQVWQTLGPPGCLAGLTELHNYFGFCQLKYLKMCYQDDVWIIYCSCQDLVWIIYSSYQDDVWIVSCSYQDYVWIFFCSYQECTGLYTVGLRTMYGLYIVLVRIMYGLYPHAQQAVSSAQHHAPLMMWENVLGSGRFTLGMFILTSSPTSTSTPTTQQLPVPHWVHGKRSFHKGCSEIVQGSVGFLVAGPFRFLS